MVLVTKFRCGARSPVSFSGSPGLESQTANTAHFLCTCPQTVQVCGRIVPEYRSSAPGLTATVQFCAHYEYIMLSLDAGDVTSVLMAS
jgi:hypothetical protein